MSGVAATGGGAGVLTVTPNPAIDLSARLPALRPGEVNRVGEHRQDPGGKGVNVSGFLAGLGAATAATGLLGRDNDSAFRALFRDAGIDDRMLDVPGSTRTNVKLVEDDRRVTDLNFPGFAVGEAEEAALERAVAAHAGAHRWTALCGSLPPGASPALHARLLHAARAAGSRVLLDASGPAFLAGLDALPDCIKPNGEELGEALGERVAGVADAAGAAARMRARGIGAVIVSLGADGAVFADAEGTVHAAGRPRALRSTVGAGDALVAGWLLAVLRGLDRDGRARLATACALGALETLGPRLPPPDEVDALAAAVRVLPLPAA